MEIYVHGMEGHTLLFPEPSQKFPEPGQKFPQTHWWSRIWLDLDSCVAETNLDNIIIFK